MMVNGPPLLKQISTPVHIPEAGLIRPNPSPIIEIRDNNDLSNSLAGSWNATQLMVPYHLNSHG